MRGELLLRGGSGNVFIVTQKHGNGFSDEAAVQRRDGEAMRRGLRARISAEISCMVMLMGAVLITFSYYAFYDAYISFYSDKAQGIVRMLADEVDAETLGGYLESGRTDAAYERMLAHFNNVKENTSELGYLYLFVPYEDYFVYILDAYTGTDDMSNISRLGDRFSYGDIEYRYLLADVRNKKPSTEVIFGKDQGYGKTVSAWAPVLNKKGELVAMVEADYVLGNLQRRINAYMTGITAFLMVGMAVVLCAILHVLKKNVTTPLEKLAVYVNSYENGEAQPKPFRFRKKDEIKLLSDSFQGMIARTNDYISRIERAAAEKERMGAELSVAAHIQANMLPCVFPPFPDRREFALFAIMTPAKEVGGDFYDFFLIDEDRLALVIADVSGKGVPAALFMVITKTLIKNHAQRGEDPEKIFENVNTQLCENNEEGMFVTAWLGILSLSTGSLAYVNAGHNMPLIKRRGGEFEFLKTDSDFVLAGMEGQQYRRSERILEAGDTLYLYTDGVTEAVNEKKQLYGDERLRYALNRNKEEPPEALLPDIRADIDRFAGEEPQFDDITMLCLRYNGESGSADSCGPEKPEETVQGMSTLRVRAEDGQLETVLAFVDAQLEAAGCPRHTAVQLAIAVEELFVNIAHYAYGGGAGEAVISMDMLPDQTGVSVTLEDGGIPYNPLERADPDIGLDAEQRPVGGLGIYMVRKSMDEMAYEYRNQKNRLTIRKHWEAADK